MKRTIEAGDDYIDSRDLIERMEELQGERELLADALQELKDEDTDDMSDEEKENHAEAIETAEKDLAEWDSDNGDELKAIQEVNDDCDGYGDWRHGVTMIHEDKWDEYVQQLAEDIGAYDSRAAQAWPLNCIDWEKAADQLLADYHAVDFDGHTYYVRA